MTKDEILLAKAEVEMAVTCGGLNAKIIAKQQEALLLREELTNKDHELREANMKISDLGHDIHKLKEKYEKPSNIQHKWNVPPKKMLVSKKEREEDEVGEGESVEGTQGSPSSKLNVFYRNGKGKNAKDPRDSACLVGIDSIYEEQSSRGGSHVGSAKK